MTKKGDTIPKYDNCLNCGKKLINLQRKFCSRKCKDRNWHTKESAYERQRKRGIKRKLKLIQLKNNACKVCGYNKNMAVLTFHHVDPKIKSFNLDLNNIAQKHWHKVIDELDKCDLLCHNCHHELHHPDLNLQNLQKKFDIT